MERRADDRRQSDRRSGTDRRAERRGESREGQPPDSVKAPQTRAWFDTAPALGGTLDPPESSLLRADRQHSADSGSSALMRILRTYAAARAALGLALLGAQGVASTLGAAVSPTVLVICALYALQSAVPWSWLWPALRFNPGPKGQTRLRRVHWLATIGTDLVAFGLLHVLNAGAGLNYAALLVLPVLMSGVLTTRIVALGTTAGVCLLLLTDAFRNVGGAAEGAAVVAQVGLAGIGLFIIVLIASELSSRMAREELSARGSLAMARQQAQLNRLVIEEMADGVLVLDRRLRVRAANPAARQLLVAHGLAAQAPFMLTELPAAMPLCRLVEEAMVEERWPEAGREVQLQFSSNQQRTLRIRMRFTRSSLGSELPQDEEPGAAGKGLCVVLMEDARTVQARLRQEKLAAMGRVSAGIAHEIRNPLAAIAQANELLLEENLPPGQEQLGRLVADNVKRLQRIVDDVLEVAPSAPVDVRSIDATAWVRSAVLDWARTARVEIAWADSQAGRLRLELPQEPVAVWFDAEHLRRVLVNLLDNALRHSSAEPHAMVLRLAIRGDRSVVLSVTNDGAPIAPDVEPHLFEPFFSTRSRGSGLGLYICRELCERYGAQIEFQPRSAHARYVNAFVVVMRAGDAAAAVPASGLGQALTGSSPEGVQAGDHNTAAT